MTGSGRDVTAEYRRNRVLILAASDRCGLCGHGGSRTVDHIVSKPNWPRLADGRPAPGFDGLGNLQPAHGSSGSDRTRRGSHNRCPVCGKLCNQVKGAGERRVRTSRNWYAAG